MVVRSGPRFRSVDRRRGLTTIAVIVAAVYLVFTALSTVWTDFLWFQSVDFVAVWRTHLLTTILLGAAGAVFVFAVIWVNLWLTDRLSPRYQLVDLGEDEELIERFREWVEPRLRLARIGLSAALAILLGAGIASWRDDVLLFLNPTNFGVADPQFNTDLSFFIFRLPLWVDLVSWVFNVGVLTLVVVVALHYLNGGIRVRQGRGVTIQPGVKAHVSIIAAILALLRALSYRLDTYELVYSSSGSFFGAGFTDVNARLPALQLLALVSILAAALFIWNIWRRDWTLAFVSIGGWLFVSIAAGLIYPAVIQRLQVDTKPLDAERPFIERNIEATRAAYGLDTTEVRPFAASAALTAENIADNRDTIDNLRLWDPGVLRRTYQNLQEIRSYYGVDRVDTDRYVIDGKPTQVMVSVRELEEGSDAIPPDWQNQRLFYTHGFGAVISRANAVERDGQPDFVLRDVPPVSSAEEIQLGIEGSRIYFGETYQPGSPVIVKTGEREQEIDFPFETGTSNNEYDGDAGVPIDNIVRRLAFALRYRDLNTLISSQLREDSRILMTRNIRERVEDIAPFLASDADPYPVVTDSGITWILDMYTLTERYPYSEPVTRDESDRLPQRSGLPRSGFNYIRNSVKATVDATNGTVVFYVIDEDDPILQSWQKVHPTLFRDFSEMPTRLVEHLRYPQDMFKIQSDMYLLYHIENTEVFFSRSDAWSIPSDPSTPNRTALNFLWGDVVAAGGINFLDEYLPNYVLLRLPGEEDLSYTLIQPFTPLNKPNMSSFLIADSTPGRYGRLIDYRLPSGSLVEGTGQVGQRINQDPEISQQITFWNQEGSTVLFGDMLVVPIEDSILYVMPVYLAAEGTDGGLPEFRRVVAVFGDRIEWDDTLDGALELVFDGDVGGAGEPGPDPIDPPPSTGDGTVDDLLRQASDAFARANQALRAGDLAEYQRLVEEAESLVEQALAALAPSATRLLPLG